MKQKNPNIKKTNTLSSKRLLNNSIKINGKYYNVKSLIDNNPLFLWEALHTKGSKLSICSPFYAKLKSVVNKVRPDLINAINQSKAEYSDKKRYEKLKKEISKHLNEGTLEKSRFKRI